MRQKIMFFLSFLMHLYNSLIINGLENPKTERDGRRFFPYRIPGQLKILKPKTHENPEIY